MSEQAKCNKQSMHSKHSRVTIDPDLGRQTHFWVSLTRNPCQSVSGLNDTEPGSHWHGFRVKQTQKWVWPPGTQILVNSDPGVFRAWGCFETCRKQLNISNRQNNKQTNATVVLFIGHLKTISTPLDYAAPNMHTGYFISFYFILCYSTSNSASANYRTDEILNIIKT